MIDQELNEKEIAPAEDAAEPAESGEITDTPPDVQEENDVQPEERDYARMEQEDLAALKRDFPELADFTSLDGLDDPRRYGELRDLGLSPKEAYLATKRQARSNTRAHLTSAAPRGAAFGQSSMSKQELEGARALFDGLSDAELHALYKRVNA